MRVLASMGLAAGLAISLSAAADASPVLVGTTTDPTAINNLVVDGTTYNVTFSTTTLNTFTQGSAQSSDAEAALVSALNAFSVTELGNTVVDTYYLVDVDNSLTSWDGPGCAVTCSAGEWAGTTNGGGFSLGGNDEDYLVASDFTPVQSTTTGVPEPFTLSLFGAGLIGAGAMRRLKKKAA
jgi:hypothetical protein